MSGDCQCGVGIIRNSDFLQLSFDYIITFYSKLPDRYKGLIKFGTLGDRTTHEGRLLYAVEITAAKAPKKTIYMQCLIHASESL